MRTVRKISLSVRVICGPLRVLSGQILIRPFIKRIRDDECRGSSKARLLKQHFPAAMRQPAYTDEQLISVTTGETHQLPSNLPRATTPVANVRGEHVFICARERRRGEDDRCATTRRGSTISSAYACMQWGWWPRRNNDESSFGAYTARHYIHGTYAQAYRNIYEQRLEKFTTRGVHASDDVHAYPEGAGVPRMKTQLEYPVEVRFSEIYAVASRTFSARDTTCFMVGRRKEKNRIRRSLFFNFSPVRRNRWRPEASRTKHIWIFISMEANMKTSSSKDD